MNPSYIFLPLLALLLAGVLLLIYYRMALRFALQAIDPQRMNYGAVLRQEMERFHSSFFPCSRSQPAAASSTRLSHKKFAGSSSSQSSDGTIQKIQMGKIRLYSRIVCRFIQPPPLQDVFYSITRQIFGCKCGEDSIEKVEIFFIPLYNKKHLRSLQQERSR